MEWSGVMKCLGIRSLLKKKTFNSTMVLSYEIQFLIFLSLPMYIYKHIQCFCSILWTNYVIIFTLQLFASHQLFHSFLILFHWYVYNACAINSVSLPSE